jgi:hypothetical protein
VNDESVEMATRLAVAVAPTLLEWLGDALWGAEGAEIGRAFGEMLRESSR